jgi:hypothetical protein
MGAFLMGVREKSRVFRGVLMVKSWWIRGELRWVERLIYLGKNLPLFLTLFLGIRPSRWRRIRLNG